MLTTAATARTSSVAPLVSAAGPSETVGLLERVRQGDQAALARLIDRATPALRRWARGRLPLWARTMHDTHDLVQEAIVRTLPRLRTFEMRHPGALQAYLQRAIANKIRDEIRRVHARPALTELSDDHRAPGPTPLDAAIGVEQAVRYREGVARLRPCERDAIVARFEHQLCYDEIARRLGKPNANAARVAVGRAVKALTAELSAGLSRG